MTGSCRADQRSGSRWTVPKLQTGIGAKDLALLPRPSSEAGLSSGVWILAAGAHLAARVVVNSNVVQLYAMPCRLSLLSRGARRGCYCILQAGPQNTTCHHQQGLPAPLDTHGTLFDHLLSTHMVPIIKLPSPLLPPPASLPSRQDSPQVTLLAIVGTGSGPGIARTGWETDFARLT